MACEVNRSPPQSGFVAPSARFLLRLHKLLLKTISFRGPFRRHFPRIGRTPLYGAGDLQCFAEGWNEPNAILDCHLRSRTPSLKLSIPISSLRVSRLCGVANFTRVTVVGSPKLHRSPCDAAAFFSESINRVIITGRYLAYSLDSTAPEVKNR